jgi:hypothetical protein
VQVVAARADPVSHGATTSASDTAAVSLRLIVAFLVGVAKDSPPSFVG